MPFILPEEIKGRVGGWLDIFLRYCLSAICKSLLIVAQRVVQQATAPGQTVPAQISLHQAPSHWP